MAEQPKQPAGAEEKPERERGRNYPGGRSEREMGTHQGGKNRPPHPADALHGDIPPDLPPRLKGV